MLNVNNGDWPAPGPKGPRFHRRDRCGTRTDSIMARVRAEHQQQLARPHGLRTHSAAGGLLLTQSVSVPGTGIQPLAPQGGDDLGARIECEHGNIARVAQPGAGKVMKRRDPDARV